MEFCDRQSDSGMATLLLTKSVHLAVPAVRPTGYTSAHRCGLFAKPVRRSIVRPATSRHVLTLSFHSPPFRPAKKKKIFYAYFFI